MPAHPAVAAGRYPCPACARPIRPVGLSSTGQRAGRWVQIFQLAAHGAPRCPGREAVLPQVGWAGLPDLDPLPAFPPPVQVTGWDRHLWLVGEAASRARSATGGVGPFHEAGRGEREHWADAASEALKAIAAGMDAAALAAHVQAQRAAARTRPDVAGCWPASALPELSEPEAAAVVTACLEVTAQSTAGLHS